MMFQIGQQVVCVDDEIHPEWVSSGFVAVGTLDGLTRGQVYTVRDIRPYIRAISVYLCEIVRPLGESDPEYGEAGYDPRRFRPVRKTDISIFTAMLAPSPKQKETV